MKKINNIIVYLLLLLPACTFSQKIIQNDWYKVDISPYKGYMNYQVLQINDTLITKATLQIKKENDKINYEIKLTNLNDSILTPIDYDIKLFEDGKHYEINGKVNRTNYEFEWLNNINEEVLKTSNNTFTSINLFYFVTKQNYKKKGIIKRFDSLEIEELHYKPIHQIEYIKDEVIQVGKNKINTKRIKHTGERIMGDTFWLDQNNQIIKFAMDDYKMYIKTTERIAKANYN
ncbi:hypothetical protein [Empedobacter sedimenti]|uniref:hypothetical protein n=1 Tax=Empedobacter sedimenti TaxID=3042610 RepID=UPI0024A61087|nr:hypothetical protein [Empedobacter sedimenti]